MLDDKENNNEVKPKIEIPQEYYDKIEQEKKEIERKEAEKQRQEDIYNNQKEETKNMFSMVILNAILLFATLFITANIFKYAIIIFCIYILIGSIFAAKKYLKKSDFPSTILVSGILVAIITFILSIVDETNIDLWTNYAIVSGSTAIIGVATTSIITWFIYDKENIKALQTLGILLYFAILIGVPYYAYKKFPQYFYQYVFMQKNEVIAQTEKDFVQRTLKNRYNQEFTCDNGRRIQSVMKYLSIRHTCSDVNNREFSVDSIAYNETDILYVVKDTYTDILYLNSFKEKLQNNLNTITGGKTTVALYPKVGCAFVGDCYDCDEYMAIYKEENDINNQYKFSTNLDMKKYLNINENDFVNTYEFKYIIDVSGRYGGQSLSNNEELITNILSTLNSNNLKNTYGYEITLKNSLEYNKDLYKVKGTTNQNNDFSNPVAVDLTKK